MKQLLCELLFSCALMHPGAQPIDDLTYGTVLYDYFQQDYQSALINAMVAEAQNRRGQDAVRFDLATGSFAFADGMYEFAADTFAAIDPGEIDQLNRMRLAFHLSREFYRRQDWAQLAQQLDQIELGETPLERKRIHPEVEYLRAELALQRGAFDTAEERLSLLDVADPLRAYGVFNLGVAYRAADRLNDAQRSFTWLAQTPAYTDETFDLGERAKLALALIARQTHQAESAESVLAGIPGSGRYQDVAMAAYGGLAMDREDYELAARIWMTLAEQDGWTPATATAHLGFPLSLEGLAGQGHSTMAMALSKFQHAEQTFSARLTNLQRFSRQVSDPETVRELLGVFAMNAIDGGGQDADSDAMRTLMHKWRAQLGHTEWLQWLAADKINVVLTQWRELNTMEGWLDELPDELDALQGVAAEQRRRNTQASDLLEGDGMLAQRARLQGRLTAAQAQLASLRAAAPVRTMQWMWPLATEQERRLLDDLTAMRMSLAHMSEGERGKWGRRIDRLEGLVFYRIVDEQAKRLQRLNADFKTLQALVARVDDQITRVQSAESVFTGGVATDFLSFLDRAEHIAAMVSDARASRESMLAREIHDRVESEMRQVQQYLLITRIAIARTTDQLAMAAPLEGEP